MWHRRSVDSSILRSLSPATLEEYVRGLGWTPVQATPDEADVDFAVFQSPADPVDQIRIPKVAGAPDFLDALGNAVGLLADASKRSPIELAEEVRFYRSDRVDFRQIGESVVGGQIRLPKGIELLTAAKQAVASAAHSVGHPTARYHPRLSKKEPATLIEECFLSTSPGSFIATVTCPINVEGAPSLGRDAVIKLLTTAEFVRSLEVGSVELIEEGVGDGDPWPVTANLCEALAAMEPEDEGGALELHARWSPSLAAPAGALQRVVLHAADFEKVRTLATELRPAEGEQPGVNRYVAWVEALSGARIYGGSCEVRASLEESEWFRATVELSAGAEWDEAYKALGESRPVVLRGGLRRKRRQPHVIEPLRSIKIVSEGDEQAPP